MRIKVIIFTVQGIVLHMYIRGQEAMGESLEFCLPHHADTNKRKIVLAILIPEKVEFMAKNITRVRGYLISIKGSTQQEDITILNSYALNNIYSR